MPLAYASADAALAPARAAAGSTVAQLWGSFDVTRRTYLGSEPADDSRSADAAAILWPAGARASERGELARYTSRIASYPLRDEATLMNAGHEAAPWS